MRINDHRDSSMTKGARLKVRRDAAINESLNN
jgi:hypothetical protein